VAKGEERKRHVREGVGEAGIRGRTCGAVSVSAEYRTWSIKLLIAPESLVTIATIIHQVSSTISRTENPIARPARPPASLSLFASFSCRVLFSLPPCFSLSRSAQPNDQPTERGRLELLTNLRSGLSLSAEAATTSASTNVSEVSLRACATLAPRTTNWGLESGLARHPCLCHGRWGAAPRARRNYPLEFGFASSSMRDRREEGWLRRCMCTSGAAERVEALQAPLNRASLTRQRDSCAFSWKIIQIVNGVQCFTLLLWSIMFSYVDLRVLCSSLTLI